MINANTLVKVTTDGYYASGSCETMPLGEAIGVLIESGFSEKRGLIFDRVVQTLTDGNFFRVPSSGAGCFFPKIELAQAVAI